MLPTNWRKRNASPAGLSCWMALDLPLNAGWLCLYDCCKSVDWLLVGHYSLEIMVCYWLFVCQVISSRFVHLVLFVEVYLYCSLWLACWLPGGPFTWCRQVWYDTALWQVSPGYGRATIVYCCGQTINSNNTNPLSWMNYANFATSATVSRRVKFKLSFHGL